MNKKSCSTKSMSKVRGRPKKMEVKIEEKEIPKHDIKGMAKSHHKERMEIAMRHAKEQKELAAKHREQMISSN